MAGLSVLIAVALHADRRLRDPHVPVAWIGVGVAPHLNLESPAWTLWLNGMGCSGAARPGACCAPRRAMAANNEMATSRNNFRSYHSRSKSPPQCGMDARRSLINMRRGAHAVYLKKNGRPGILSRAGRHP